MTKLSLSPVVSTPAVAVSFFVPARSMLKPVKVARPLVSVLRVAVPLRTPLPLLNAMLADRPDTLFPKLSCARTVTAGLIDAPAAASLGCPTKDRFAAAAALTTTLLEVAPMSPVALKSIVMVVAVLWDKLVNVTSPPVAVISVVPWSESVPALRVALTTVLLSFVTRLLNGSSIRMTGCCAKTTPAVATREG